MCVLVVQVVFTNVDNGQLPQLRQVHNFVQHALSQRTFSKKADRNRAVVQMLRGKCRPGCDAHTARDDCVGSEIACGGIGNVHRPSFAPAISGFLAQQLGKHTVRRCAFSQAVTVTAVRAGDAILDTQRLADSHRDGFLAVVQVRQARHQCACVELVHLLFKQTNAHHLPVHVQPLLDSGTGRYIRLTAGDGHFPAPDLARPDMWANTSNTTAKSCSSRPIARAAVKNSFEIAVVGSGTFSFRPMSSASSMSFCIMFTLNQASSGCLSTNGPRYWIIGDATALCTSTSTAVSRAIPLFSARITPSQKPIIWIARFKFVAIFIESARPLSPTYVTFGPMSSSSGFSRSKVSRRPPTITDSFPCCRVMTLPDTGESTMSAPFSRSVAATVRLNSGLTVLISTNNFPRLRAANIPSGPFTIASSAAELVTIANVTSAAAATSRGEFPHFIPRSISHCAFFLVRLKPVTVCPLSIRRFTICPPIVPRPMNPRFAICAESPN